MTKPDYLQYKFEDTPEFISTFDELPLWSIIPDAQHIAVFNALEENHNTYSERAGSLTLTVPMAYIEGAKPCQ